MGVASIDAVLDRVRSGELKKCLTDCKRKHEELKSETASLLISHGDDGKEPSPAAKGMSRLKTEMKMGVDSSDETVADLMADGCNMGVKSLSRYLNQYAAADEVSKDIAKRLIALEERLAVDLRAYL